LIGVPQEPEWHPEGDVFVHTQLVVDRARERINDLDYPRKVTVMLAALSHDFGNHPRPSLSMDVGVPAVTRMPASRRQNSFWMFLTYTLSTDMTCAAR